MMKRIFALILTAVLLLTCVAGAAGYSLDPDAINKSASSVVLVACYNIAGRLLGTGSGFAAFDGKYIVTNYHVIDGADIAAVYTDDGDLLWASRVLCADSGRDIAILVLDEDAALPPLPLNETGEVTRGAPAVAIGSPFGFRNSVSIGSVSASEVEYEGFIGFNAPVSSGSSGGALLDDDGKVIGVTSVVVGGDPDAQNVNFAVDIKYVIEMYDSHAADETVLLRDVKKIDLKTEVKEPEDYFVPDSREFSISNLAGFSISEVYLYPDGAKSWGKVKNTAGWLTAGNKMTFTVTDEEALADTLYTVNVCFYYQKQAYYMDFTGINLKKLLGHTLVIRMLDGNYVGIDIE